jgi:hypothetical protein
MYKMYITIGFGVIAIISLIIFDYVLGKDLKYKAVSTTQNNTKDKANNLNEI